MHEMMSTKFYMLIFVIFAVVLSGLILLVCKVMNDLDNGPKSERPKDYEPPENIKR